MKKIEGETEIKKTKRDWEREREIRKRKGQGREREKAWWRVIKRNEERVWERKA